MEAWARFPALLHPADRLQKTPQPADTFCWAQAFAPVPACPDQSARATLCRRAASQPSCSNESTGKWLPFSFLLAKSARALPLGGQSKEDQETNSSAEWCYPRLTCERIHERVTRVFQSPVLASGVSR